MLLSTIAEIFICIGFLGFIFNMVKSPNFFNIKSHLYSTFPFIIGIVILFITL
jgi:hypothetical protein